MQINRWLIFIIAISTLIVETNAATITAEAPGTVFTNREPLRFQLNQRPPAPLRYEVRNFRGRIVTAGEWSGEGHLELAPLPPGYYVLSTGEKNRECSFVVTVDPAERKSSGESPFALDSAQSWHGGGRKRIPAHGRTHAAHRNVNGPGAPELGLGGKRSSKCRREDRQLQLVEL